MNRNKFILIFSLLLLTPLLYGAAEEKMPLILCANDGSSVEIELDREKLTQRSGYFRLLFGSECSTQTRQQEGTIDVPVDNVEELLCLDRLLDLESEAAAEKYVSETNRDLGIIALISGLFWLHGPEAALVKHFSKHYKKIKLLHLQDGPISDKELKKLRGLAHLESLLPEYSSKLFTICANPRGISSERSNPVKIRAGVGDTTWDVFKIAAVKLGYPDDTTAAGAMRLIGSNNPSYVFFQPGHPEISLAEQELAVHTDLIFDKYSYPVSVDYPGTTGSIIYNYKDQEIWEASICQNYSSYWGDWYP